MGRDQDGGFAGLVGGANIEIKDQAGSVVARVKASPHGYYKADLLPGQYFYSVKAGGYKDEDAGRGMRLKLSEGYSVFHFSLTKGENDPNRDADQPAEQDPVGVGRLHGRVFEMSPKPRPIGVAKALVTLRKEGSTELVRVVTRSGGKDNNDTGAYEVILEEGVWWASVTTRGFQPLKPDTNNKAEAIVIVADGEAKRNFTLYRQQSETTSDQGIKGLVRVLNQEGKPVSSPNVRVHIVSLGGRKKVSETTTLDNAGGFRKELPIGRYRVVAKAPGYRPAKSPLTFVFRDRYSRVDLILKPITEPEQPEVQVVQADDREVKPERQDVIVDRQDNEASKPVLVRVRVFDDAKKRPLQNADVLLRRPRQSLADAVRGTTNMRGELELKVDGLGPCVVLARADGYRPGGAKLILEKVLNQADVLLEPLSVQPPVGPQPGETAVEPGRTPARRPFQIIVYNVKTRKPLPNTAVQLVGRAAGGKTSGVAVRRITDSRGELQLQIPGGAYEVSARRTGYLPWIQKMTLDPRKHSITIAMRSQSRPTPGTDEQASQSTAPRHPDPTDAIVTVSGRVYYMSTSGAFSLRRPSIGSMTTKPGTVGVPGVKLIWRQLDASRRPSKSAMSTLNVGYRGLLGSSPAPVTSGASGRYSIRLPEGRYQVQIVAPQGYRASRDSEIVLVRRGMSEKNFLLSRGVRPVDPNSGRPNGSNSAANQHVQPLNQIAPQLLNRFSTDNRQMHSGASSSRKPNSPSTQQTLYIVEYRHRKTRTAWKIFAEYRNRSHAYAALQSLQKKYRGAEVELCDSKGIFPCGGSPH